MKKYITLLLAACISSYAISAKIANAHPEEFAEMQTEHNDAITRAVNTVVFNNVLIEGDTNIKKNLVVDGFITGTLVGGSCPNVTGPATSTLNAFARYADTSGNVLANSGVIADNSGNISSIAQLTAETISTTTFNITGGQLIAAQVSCNQAIQDVPFDTSLISSATANTETSILILRPNDGNATEGFTIIFPSAPANGQLFTIINGTSNNINTSGGGTFTLSAPGGATIVNPITALNVSIGNPDPAAMYIYYEPDNTWYLAATPNRVVL